MKKTLLSLLVIFLCLTSAALGYYGGSNMGYHYPNFSSYVPYNASYDQVKRYSEEGERYIKACDSDIYLIQEQRNKAVRDVNSAVSSYNTRSRSR